MNDWEAIEGSPFPCGATWIEAEQAYNFSLYSKHGEVVRLLLYSPEDVISPLLDYEFDPHYNKSGPIWHCRIPQADVGNARYYAYRVDGPAPGRHR
ncbi:MAG: glycogen-debranching protein, partial [Pirellulales bacterium]|nr:glycogen-debranching protein [Pirellulales bacterium]